MGSTVTTTRPLDEGQVPDTAELPVERSDAPVPFEAPQRPAPPAPPARGRVVPRTFWFFTILAVLGLSAAVGLTLVLHAVADANPFKNGLVTQRTVDRSGPAVLKAV